MVLEILAKKFKTLQQQTVGVHFQARSILEADNRASLFCFPETRSGSTDFDVLILPKFDSNSCSLFLKFVLSLSLPGFPFYNLLFSLVVSLMDMLTLPNTFDDYFTKILVFVMLADDLNAIASQSSRDDY